MRSRIEGIGVQSRVQPKMVSISQATEYGTVYTPDELRALTSAAHEAGLYVHMDGARIANAAASLGVGLAEASSACGIDVLSFGATKNGALCAEAVVFFDEKLAEGFGYRRKQGMQLASKMRFVAAQIVGLLDDDTWLENARQANAMAKRLGDGLAAMSGVTLTQSVDSNQVFVRIAPERLAALQRAGVFHTWDAAKSEYRFVCAYDQTAEDVDRFLAAARGR
jgi:threonine aldolase